MRYAFRFVFLLLLAFTLWTGPAKAQEGTGLQVLKLGSPEAVPGGFMTYSIFVTNNGTSFFFDSCVAIAGCSVVLTDDLPANFLFNELDITATKYFATLPPVTVPCAVVAGDLVCDIGDFVPTNFVEINIPGTASATLSPGDMITNDVLVDPVGGLTGLGPDTDSFDTTIVSSAPQVNLAIFKTDAPDPVIGEAGNILTYTLAVTNSGPDDATNVVVTDFIPPTASFDSVMPAGPCSHDGSPTGGIVTCTFPSLAAGDIGMITITVNPPVLAIGNQDVAILNVATVTSDQVDGALSDNTVGEGTIVTAPVPNETISDLIVTKAAPNIVIQNQEFFYSIEVFNVGPDPAVNVTLRDSPFMNTTINGAGIVANAPIACFPLALPNFACDILVPIPPGQSVEFLVPATYTGGLPTLPDPLPIFNVANVILGPSNIPDTIQVDPIPSNNTFVNVTNVVPPPAIISESDLVMTKTAPEIVVQGENFEYTLFVTNLGDNVAENVTVTDILPPSVDIVTLPMGCVEMPAMSNIVECTIPSIAVDTVIQLIIEVTPNDLGLIYNIATTSLGLSNQPNTQQVDPVPGNNTDSAVSEVIPPPIMTTTSNLVVKKAAPILVIEDNEFEYDIEVTNLGPDLAQNVILTDIIPEDVTFSNLPAGCGVVVNAPPANDELVCNLGDIAMAQVIRLSITAQYTGAFPALPDSFVLFNLVNVEFGLVDNLMQIDPETSNNTDIALTRIIAEPPAINLVDLFVVKTDSPDPVVTGTDLTYNLFVYNFGPNNAENVIVTDTLPSGAALVSAPGCVPAGNVLTCVIPLIQSNGGVAIIPIMVTAPPIPPDEESFMILNAARADVDPFFLLSDNIIQLDYAPSNNTDSEKTTVVPEPPPMSDLLILKTDTPDPVIEDDVLTYTIFVKNTGPDPAFGVLVSDWLPQEGLDLDTVNFSFSPNVAGCIQDPDVAMEPYKVECLIPSLGVEESATITVAVTTLPLPDGVEFLNIFNLAKVESIGDEINPPSADPNPLNNVVVESTLIGEFVPIADLFIIKSDSPDPVFVDQTLTYVLFVSNAGPDPATNVVVTDTLPDSVDLISATPDQGVCGGLVGDMITCNLGNLAVGAFTEIRILVTPTIPGTILNVAQVMGDEHDPKSSNNISPQTTTVNPKIFTPPDNPGEPNGNDIFILKFVSPNPVEVGQEVAFTIIVGNNGEFGSGATVVDDLPAGLTFLSATVNTGDPCNLVNGDVVCDIGTIPPLGQGQTVVVEVRAIADQTGTLPNTAFLDNVPNDPVTNNNVSIVALTVVPDISVPQPPANPDDGDDGDGGNDGDTGGSNNGGCTVAAGSINTSSTATNFALLLLPLLVFGFRSIRRKK